MAPKSKTQPINSGDARIEGYRVTSSAPATVAGRRVFPGEVLQISEAEARSEVLFGNLSPIFASDLEAE